MKTSPMNRWGTKCLLVVIAVLAVVCWMSNREKSVVVEGKFSASDLREIKRAALKKDRDFLFQTFKDCARAREFKRAAYALKCYASLRVLTIKQLGPPTALQPNERAEVTIGYSPSDVWMGYSVTKYERWHTSASFVPTH